LNLKQIFFSFFNPPFFIIRAFGLKIFKRDLVLEEIVGAEVITAHVPAAVKICTIFGSAKGCIFVAQHFSPPKFFKTHKVNVFHRV